MPVELGELSDDNFEPKLKECVDGILEVICPLRTIT
jgi:hypothetical protein